jgi:uncharacterized repeat protein (TIGR01451 family)
VRPIVSRPGDAVFVGDTVEFELTVRNTGNDDALDVTLTDVLPIGFTYVAGSTSVVNGPLSGAKTDARDSDGVDFDTASRTLVVRLGAGADGTKGGSLAIGESQTVRFRATVAAGQGGQILTNQAKVAGRGLHGSPRDEWASDSGDGGLPRSYGRARRYMRARRRVPGDTLLAHAPLRLRDLQRGLRPRAPLSPASTPRGPRATPRGRLVARAASARPSTSRAAPRPRRPRATRSRARAPLASPTTAPRRAAPAPRSRRRCASWPGPRPGSASSALRLKSARACARCAPRRTSARGVRATSARLGPRPAPRPRSRSAGPPARAGSAHRTPIVWAAPAPSAT